MLFVTRGARYKNVVWLSAAGRFFSHASIGLTYLIRRSNTVFWLWTISFKKIIIYQKHIVITINARIGHLSGRR